MSKKQHIGKLETRRMGFRNPDMGYYLIVTDAVETEPNFFNGLKDNLPESIKDRLVIKVKTSKTYDMFETMQIEMAKIPNICEPWIVFDKDQVKGFDNLISDARKKNINVGWSNPCVEILFLAYLGKTPNVNDSKVCIKEFTNLFFKLSGKEYEKNNKHIYDELKAIGDEKEAVLLSEKKFKGYIENGIKVASKMDGVSVLYLLIKEISAKAGKKESA